MDDKDIVSAVRALLADKVGRDNFELWFGPSTRLAFAAGVLTVTAANGFAQDWLRAHYRGAIEAACHEVLGRAAAVEFHVDEPLATSQSGPRRGKSHRQTALVDESRELGDAAVAVLDPPSKAAEHVGLHAGKTLFAAAGNREGGSRQNRHAASVANQNSRSETASRRRFATLDSFVVGGSNRLAHATALMIAEKPGSLSPFLIYGPSGCGKTHLLEGVWSAAHARRRGVNAVFLSAEQFTTLFVEALRGGGLPNFRRKYRGVDLLVVDDLQFLVGKRATLVELLHTIDALQRDGKQLVFSADRAPVELCELGPELTTRLAGGMACGLDQPDLPTRIGLVHQFSHRLEVEFPQDVAECIAGQVTAGAREVSGAVNRIHAASRILNEPIARTLAEVSLAEMLRHHTKPVRLADIERAVCDVFGLSSESLQSGRRAKAVSSARMLAMWLARKHTRAGLSEIGQHFGRRSHSTVISAQKRVTDWLARQTDVDLSDRRCTVDEAIRRVEQKLCAG